ncbi:MAG: ATP-binding cassette domain-containing protein [Nitrosarchaeum sp.]|nr:ATP-binding cassette domain-containing protein [Nitrosarchaeum sp.]
MSAIKIKNLTKKFGKFIAVDSINLEIKEGELFGLLGPNGAGKSTTLNMLATMMMPTSGNATINNVEITSQDSVRRTIGMVFQDPSLDDELTGKENLEFHGRMYHMQKNLRANRIEEVLKLVGLEDKAKFQIKTYSGGMKRRLEIARGLMHHPKILFLDEPTLGLDPQTRRGIWDYIQKLNKDEGLTIILTTHYMEEADYLCDRIAIIDNGKIIALDTPENMKNIMGGDILKIETRESGSLDKILKFDWIKDKTRFDDYLNVTVADGGSAIPDILKAASEAGIKIDSVHMIRPSLEDVFIHYTGRTIREQEADSTNQIKSMMNQWGKR